MVQLPPVCYAHLPINKHVMSTSYASGSVQWAGHANFPSHEAYTPVMWCNWGQTVITQSHRCTGPNVVCAHLPPCRTCGFQLGSPNRVTMGDGRWRKEEGGGRWALAPLAPCLLHTWVAASSTEGSAPVFPHPYLPPTASENFGPREIEFPLII